MRLVPFDVYQSYEKQQMFFHEQYKPECNLFNILVDRTKTDAKRVIFRDIQGEITYEKLLLNACALSGSFGSLFPEEKRIALFLPNSIAHVVSLFALFKLGKTPCVLNFSMGEGTLRDCLETAEVKTIVTSRLFVEKGSFGDLFTSLSVHYRIVYLEDVKDEMSVKTKAAGFLFSKLKTKSSAKKNEVIIYTSGTESKPKGVILTHENFQANVLQAICSIELFEHDKLFNPLPMFHSFGLCIGVFLPIIENLPCFLYPSPLFYKEIPKAIHESRSTILVGTSTFFDGYAKYAKPFELSSLRYVVAGAEKLKDHVRNDWQSKFSIRIMEGYGVTETAPVLSINTNYIYKEGTTGRILPGMEYKIEPVDGIKEGGTLLVKGPNVMKGYLIHGKGFVPTEEWYNTGDVVTVDENHLITIQARLKRFAKIAGEMISLNAVEQYAYEAYHDPSFYAVSVPDEKKGERIVCFTTNCEADDKLYKKYIKEHKLSNLYIPYKFVTIEEIPMLPTGKADYRKLQELALDVKKGWFGK